jgi:hypothetical protein
MDEWTDEGNQPKPRYGVWIAGAVLALVGLAAAYVVLSPRSRPQAPAAPPQASAVPTPDVRPTVTPTVTPTPTTAAAPEAARRRARTPAPTPSAAPEPPPPAAPTTAVLTVEADVPGASVFLDRKYVGVAPITVDDVAPGPHQINVTAEGFEGQMQSLNLSPGPARVEIRFKEVRLDAAIDVVHRHGVGSCSGRLRASPAGLVYEGGNKDDVFKLAFAEVETFDVDYLKKALRVKRRGGRTWNFGHPKDDADALFVFHRDVQKARTRLAAR